MVTISDHKDIHMSLEMKVELMNAAAFKSSLNRVAKNAQKVLPYTLTQCAFEGRKELQGTLERYISKPVPATKRGIFYTKANHLDKTPFSEVRWSPLAWKYMKYAVIGGNRRGSAPVAARKNAYGNVVPSQRASRIKGNANIFRKRVNGLDGLWKKTRGGVSLMHVYKESMRYEVILPMQSIVYQKAASVFQAKFKSNMEGAIRRGVGV
jgi:hypothetical protein